MKSFPKFFVAVLAVLFAGLSCTAAQNNSPSNGAQASARQAASATTAAGQAKLDPAKEADIRRLLDLVGTKALMAQSMDAMIGNIKPMLTNALPAGEYRAKLVELFFEKFQTKANLQVMLNIAVSAYDKNFSHEEVKGLIKFYETPLGQRAASVLPQLVAEMRAAGEKWGEQLGRESMQEVLTEHPDMQAALEAAGKAAQPR